MKLYLLSQSQNMGHDTYDSMVVAAKNEDDAKTILPDSPHSTWGGSWSYGWAKSPEHVSAKLIGTAIKGTERGVICASFNAG